MVVIVQTIAQSALIRDRGLHKGHESACYCAIVTLTDGAVFTQLLMTMMTRELNHCCYRNVRINNLHRTRNAVLAA